MEELLEEELEELLLELLEEELLLEELLEEELEEEVQHCQFRILLPHGHGQSYWLHMYWPGPVQDGWLSQCPEPGPHSRQLVQAHPGQSLHGEKHIPLPQGFSLLQSLAILQSLHCTGPGMPVTAGMRIEARIVIKIRVRSKENLGRQILMVSFIVPVIFYRVVLRA